MTGLYDTKDSVWIGDDHGPRLYEDDQIAKVAAMIVDRAMHWPMGRTRAIPWSPAYVRLRDTVMPLETAEQALAHLEEGL